MRCSMIGPRLMIAGSKRVFDMPDRTVIEQIKHPYRTRIKHIKHIEHSALFDQTVFDVGQVFDQTHQTVIEQ